MTKSDPEFDRVVHVARLGWLLKKIADHDPAVRVKTHDYGSEAIIEWTVRMRMPTRELKQLLATYNLLR